MSEELKNCPFCGGKAKEQNIIIVGRGLCKMVFCENCNIDFKTPTSIVQWNTRPEEERLKAENERLKDENEALIQHVAQLKARLKAMEEAYAEMFKKNVPEKIMVIK